MDGELAESEKLLGWRSDWESTEKAVRMLKFCLDELKYVQNTWAGD